MDMLIRKIDNVSHTTGKECGNTDVSKKKISAFFGIKIPIDAQNPLADRD